MGSKIMGSVFKVCIPNTLHQGFDYLAPGQAPDIGARVWVPFRKQTRLGIVIAQKSHGEPKKTLKSISKVIDQQPLLSPELLALCQWVSDYYQSPLSEVITLALPKKYREGLDVSKPVDYIYFLATAPEKALQQLGNKAYRQRALLTYLADIKNGQTKKAIVSAGFSTAQLNALVKLKLLTSKKISTSIQPKDLLSPPLILNPEQKEAKQTILQTLNIYHAYLLHGVTGSGKTEVYLQVIKEVLRLKRQALILVPEIGLTPQLVTRFSARFAENIAVIHSHLNDNERQRAWHAAKSGEARLVIGTRSAVFSPMPELGLIVIDEEHDPSFKQMEGVRYSARDTALFRAHREQVPIILGSATPSLEALHNCTVKKYTYLPLTQKALNNHRLHYQVIDIRNKSLYQGLAGSTLKLIEKHLKNNNQVLVFINRRGFAPVLLCHQCGWMADCKACDAHLTLHRSMERMLCHHCGLMESIPARCKACSGSELIPVGAGTQRVHEFLINHFPNTRVLRIDRDEVRQKEAFVRCLKQINQGDAQLIVGTQMLAKGHHFPCLTLVVILDADNGLHNQDFRALERLGQLLTQVAGRAGRATYPGEVAIQTHMPNHPFLNLLLKKGYEAFAQTLLEKRKQAELPPFHFLALIRAQSKQEDKSLIFLHALKEHLQNQKLDVLGPAPAPLTKKGHQYRFQLLIKSCSRKKLHAALTAIGSLPTIKKITQGVRWNVDVDPIDLT